MLGRRRRSYSSNSVHAGGGGGAPEAAIHWYSARAGTTNPFSMTVDVTKVHFEENVTTDYNPGDWDTTDHDFTCSEAGLYLITFVYGVRFGDNVAPSVWLNGSEYKQMTENISADGAAFGIIVMDLAVNDVVDFRQWAHGGRINGNSHLSQLEIVKIG